MHAWAMNVKKGSLASGFLRSSFEIEVSPRCTSCVPERSAEICCSISPGLEMSGKHASEIAISEGKQERPKKGPSREKVEELKREAKLSRELVQMEKMMEERKKKRQRRDEGLGDDDDGGGGDVVSQNEMF